MDHIDPLVKQEIDKAILKTGIASNVDELIGKNDTGWYKDFLLGIKCGIAAQKMVR